MKELTLPRPTEKQKLFLEDQHRYLAFGGSRGGGKSFAVRMDAIIKCIRLLKFLFNICCELSFALFSGNRRICQILFRQAEQKPLTALPYAGDHEGQ